MLTYRRSLNAYTVLHYCKLTSVLPTQKSYTDVRYGEILLFMVKPAELILLMLSDISISLHVCVQKQSVEAAFPSPPPK